MFKWLLDLYLSLPLDCKLYMGCFTYCYILSVHLGDWHIIGAQ